MNDNNLLETIGIVFKRDWNKMNKNEKTNLVKCLVKNNRPDVEDLLDELGVK